MKNIVLIGMPACGKSTIGVILAKTMGIGFLDTDLLLQQREGKRLQEIIDGHGLPYFLRVESHAIQSIDCRDTVIATGGSAVYSEIAMRHLHLSSILIYLQRRMRRLSIGSIISKRGALPWKRANLSIRFIRSVRRCMKSGPILSLMRRAKRQSRR